MLSQVAKGRMEPILQHDRTIVYIYNDIGRKPEDTYVLASAIQLGPRSHEPLVVPQHQGCFNVVRKGAPTLLRIHRLE